MYEGCKVVCAIPAGRRRYMRLLLPYVLSSPLVDRYDIWVNTENAADLAFFDGVAALDNRVKLVPQPDGVVDGAKSVTAFHRLCTEESTIYVRFDDDIVWLEPGFMERFLAFRVAHPEFLLTMPLIINNGICTAILERLGKIRISRTIGLTSADPITWRDGAFAISLQRLFLDLIETRDWGQFHSGHFPISMARFSINCISWFGHDLAKYPGLIEGDDEAAWTTYAAIGSRRCNGIITDTIAVHYAFFPQRYHVDRTNLLDRYEDALKTDPKLAALLSGLDAIPSPQGTGDGGSKISVPGLRERLRLWLRPYRGREIIVTLP